MFYPTESDVTIKQGDSVAAVCTMFNSQSRTVRIGYEHFLFFRKSNFFFRDFSSTGNDEMCNFYMMYWVDGDKLLNEDVCTSPGPPKYYFRHDRVCLFFLFFFNIDFLSFSAFEC
jgi:peptidylglycine monooxygenase